MQHLVMMWVLVIALLLIPFESAAASGGCLDGAEARRTVQEERLIELQEARGIASARARGEIVSANLCRVDNRLVYVLAVLSREGRVVRIGVDARNRAVEELR